MKSNAEFSLVHWIDCLVQQRILDLLGDELARIDRCLQKLESDNQDKAIDIQNLYRRTEPGLPPDDD